MDIRYFFIKDRLDVESIKVEYCPTEEMLADFFTKPLQGNLFRKLRGVIMGQEHIDALEDITSPSLQQRVEGQTVSEKSGRETDVRRTDEKAREAAVASEQPRAKETYADVVRKRIGNLKTVVESARSSSRSPRTLLN